MRDLTAIKSLVEDLKKDGTGRHRRYRELDAAYAGDFEERKRKGYWKRLTDVLVPTQEDNRQKIYTVVNLLRPIVEQKRAMIGKMPSIQVLPPGQEEEDYEHADLVEKWLYSMWRESAMPRRMGDMGFLLPHYGTAVAMLHTDIEKKKVRILIRSPRNFYCIPKTDDQYLLAKAVFIAKYSGREAAELFPGFHLDEHPEVEVVDYNDEDDRVVYCDVVDRPLLMVENKFADLPIVTIPNIAIPGSALGDSDVEQAMELQRQYSQLSSLQMDAIVRTLYAPWVIKNPIKAPKQIPLDPYAVIPVGEGGDLRPAQPAQVPYQFFQAKNDIQGLIDVVADAPSALRGQMDSSTVTQKGFNAIMSPYQGRMEIRQQYIFPAIEYLDRLAIDFATRVWAKETLQLFGMRQGEVFAREISGADLKGWAEHEVYLPASAFIDDQGRHMMALQDLNAQTLSKKSFMFQSPLVRDVGAELKQIDKERQQMIQETLQMQALAAAPTTASPDTDQVAMQQAALEKGSTNELQPPGLPGGAVLPSGSPPQPTLMPGAGAAGAPAAGEQSFIDLEGDVFDLGGADEENLMALADEFRDIAKIKGQVFLAGQCLTGDLAMIDVYLTDQTDKQTIINHMKKHVPPLDGRFGFLPAPAPEPYLEVTPGTTGYEPVGGAPVGAGTEPGAPPAGGEEVPPDIMAQLQGMMGGGM